MTSQQEFDIAEETISILREAEAAVRKEIKESGQCLNIDFNRVSVIQGAIVSQKKWAGYYRVKIAMRQRHDSQHRLC